MGRGIGTKSQDRRNCCSGCAALTGIVLIVFAVLSLFFFQALVDSIIYGEMPIQTNSQLYETWKAPPVGPRTKFNFFNLTNPDGFLQGEKPVFKELGPYTYRESWLRDNVTFYDNGTVSYNTRKWYFFMPDESSGSESDLIFSINVPAVSAVYQMRFKNQMTKLAIGSFLKVFNMGMLENRTVHEWIWGYHSQLLELAAGIMPPGETMPHKSFGWFVGKNGTPADTLTVYTGKDDITQYASLDRWKGMAKLPFWNTKQCNKLSGTDGSGFAPDVQRDDTLYLFNPDLCRSLPLVYEADRTYGDLLSYRFTPPEDVFASVEDRPENLCYCRDGPPCSRAGLFNISVCKYGSPTIMSFPHFYLGDPKLLDDVVGLDPQKEKHQFYMDIQPKVGISLGAAARFQINMALLPVPEIKQSLVLPEIIFPCVWFQTGMDSLPEAVSSKLRLATVTPHIAQKAIVIVFFVVGGVLLVAAVFYITKVMIRRRQSSSGDKAALENGKNVGSNGTYSLKPMETKPPSVPPQQPSLASED